MHLKLDGGEHCLISEWFVPCSSSKVMCFTGKTGCTRQAQTCTKTGVKRSKKWAKTQNKTEKCAQTQTNTGPAEAKGRTTKSWYKKLVQAFFMYTMSSFCIFKELYNNRLLNVWMMDSSVAAQEVVWSRWGWGIFQLAAGNRRRSCNHLLRAGTHTPTSEWRWASE